MGEDELLFDTWMKQYEKKVLERAEMDKTELQYEKRDSVEVTRNAKGEYGWKIKRYYEASEDSVEDIISHIEYTDHRLREAFL